MVSRWDLRISTAFSVIRNRLGAFIAFEPVYGLSYIPGFVRDCAEWVRGCRGLTLGNTGVVDLSLLSGSHWFQFYPRTERLYRICLAVGNGRIPGSWHIQHQ